VLAGGARVRGHAADVPLEAIEVEEQGGSWNVVASHSKTALTLARGRSAQAQEVSLLDAASDGVVEIWPPIGGGRLLLAQAIPGPLRTLALGGRAIRLAHGLAERRRRMHDGPAGRGFTSAPDREERRILAGASCAEATSGARSASALTICRSTM